MTKFVNRFVVSDHHFGHTNSWEKFKLADGSPLRPFTSDDEMNEAMIERHNAKSGLLKFFDIASHMGAFTRIEFSVDDIVRSSLVKDYILAKLRYEDLIEGKRNDHS